MTLFGSDLADTTAQADATPLPKTLGGVSVALNGVPLPLVYASPSQVNAQIPYETPTGPAILTVFARGTVSSDIPITLTSAAPGIFLWGSGRAVVQNQDFTLNTPDNPARVGSFVTVYATGQGKVSVPVVTGAASPSSPLAESVLPVTARIGGVPAEVTFAGLTPGFVGLLQVNVKIPVLPSGDHPLVITVGGQTSSAGLMSVLE